ncbi:MAG: TVP38/TMEM64 family protein [Clostridia bacterium]|nr:TVP38/TMEM64 family protein [Clostridia bacterium]
MKSKETIVKYTATALLAVLLLISAIFMISGWRNGHFDSFDSFRTYIISFGVWAPIILTLIQALQVVIPVLPGFLGCIVGAALFGAAGGFWTNYIGISLGSIVAYWLARWFGINIIEKMFSLKKYEPYIEKIQKSKSYTTLLFLSILLPLAPDDFLCYFSGLINMPAKKFTAIILLAKPWCILFYSLFFAYFI